MADLNQVNLIGRLTRDPQLKYLPSQTAVCEFGLAVGEKWKDKDGNVQERTTFVDVAAFGKLAEVVNEYCQKGRQVYIGGKLKLDQWDDRTTGAKRSKLSVIADDVIFLSQPGGNSQGGERPRQQQRPAPASRSGGYGSGSKSSESAEEPFGDEPQFTGDDIPF